MYVPLSSSFSTLLRLDSYVTSFYTSPPFGLMHEILEHQYFRGLKNIKVLTHQYGYSIKTLPSLSAAGSVEIIWLVNAMLSSCKCFWSLLHVSYMLHTCFLPVSSMFLPCVFTASLISWTTAGFDDETLLNRSFASGSISKFAPTINSDWSIT